MTSVLEVSALEDKDEPGEVGLVFPDLKKKEDKQEYEQDNTSNFWWWNYWVPYFP